MRAGGPDRCRCRTPRRELAPYAETTRGGSAVRRCRWRYSLHYPSRYCRPGSEVAFDEFGLDGVSRVRAIQQWCRTVNWRRTPRFEPSAATRCRTCRRLRDSESDAACSCAHHSARSQRHTKAPSCSAARLSRYVEVYLDHRGTSRRLPTGGRGLRALRHRRDADDVRRDVFGYVHACAVTALARWKARDGSAAPNVARRSRPRFFRSVQAIDADRGTDRGRSGDPRRSTL